MGAGCQAPFRVLEKSSSMTMPSEFCFRRGNDKLSGETNDRCLRHSFNRELASSKKILRFASGGRMAGGGWGRAPVSLVPLAVQQHQRPHRGCTHEAPLLPKGQRSLQPLQSWAHTLRTCRPQTRLSAIARPTTRGEKWAEVFSDGHWSQLLTRSRGTRPSVPMASVDVRLN